MHELVRRASCGAGAAFLTVLAGCVVASPPAVESVRLTETDIEVLRVTLASAIQPLMGLDRTQAAALDIATLAIPLAQSRPRSATTPRSDPSAPFPTPPSPSDAAAFIRPSGDRKTQVGEDLTGLLTPEERNAWQLRNRVSREIQEFSLAGLVVRRPGELSGATPVVAVSSPSYPTKDTALVYAQFECGGLCGEGRLIRLSRSDLSWRVTASFELWIR
jgi:hypothetical protein